MSIMLCQQCKKYTLKDNCPSCRKKTINPQPAKFSPEDKYGKYRRLQKKEEMAKR
jgi:H/ACA ribonucleoprotein complex subunit 3